MQQLKGVVYIPNVDDYFVFLLGTTRDLHWPRPSSKSNVDGGVSEFRALSGSSAKTAPR